MKREQHLPVDESARGSGKGLHFDWISLWLFLPPLIVGAFLRAFQLSRQIPVGDEWHNLDAVWRLPFPGILCSFDPRFSVPMVLWGKLLLNTTGLSELGLYLPTFLCGLLTLGLFPVLIRPWVERRTRVLLTWILALSPMLILYSRFYRPYAFNVSLGFASLYFGWKWWNDKRRSFGVLYALSALLAIWIHVITAAFVLTPLLLMILLRRPAGGLPAPIPLRKMLGVTTFMSVSLILIALPILSASDVLGKKLARQMIGAATVRHAIELFSGIPALLPSVVLILLAIWGLVLLYQKNPGATTFVLIACLFQALSILLLAPTSIASALVFSRYLIPALPFFLLCVSTGFIALTGAVFGEKKKWLRRISLSLVLLALFFAGPLPRAFFRPNSWCTLTLSVEMLRGNSNARIRQCSSSFRENITEVSPFYKALRSLPAGSVRIAETPWFFRLTLNKEPWLQEFHRQQSIIGLNSCIVDIPPAKGSFPCALKGLDFQNMVFLGEDLEDVMLDFIVVHRNLLTEFSAGEVRRAGLIRKLKQQLPPVSELVAYLRSHYGLPCYEDEELIVFSASSRGRQLVDSLSISPGSI